MKLIGQMGLNEHWLVDVYLICRGTVAQLAEAGDLKSPQCGFDSHRSYLSG